MRAYSYPGGARYVGTVACSDAVIPLDLSETPAQVIGNVWAILHDPAVFPNPESFDPAHFIPKNLGGMYPAEACKDNKPPPPDAAFGFGRRMCPGRALAKTSVWLTVASVLAAFEITAAKGKDGSPVPVADTWSSGVVGYPGPFECNIRLRGKLAAQVVMHA